MRILSLFDGISCGMIAAERAGITVTKYDAYEIDENAIKISEHNYPQIKQKGDVFKAEYVEDDYNLLIGGSPCTYWSINQKPDRREKTSTGLGWELFSQYARALREAKPRYFLYENNASMSEEIKNEITKTLKVEPVLINSADFSAQKRLRYYWTNINILEWERKNIHVKDILDYSYVGENLINEMKNTDKRKADQNDLIRVGTIGKGGQGERVYSIDGKTCTIKANGGGRGAKTGMYLINDVVRKLTPLEAERAQTLPDNYTNVGISNTARYKGIGNGWTVDVIAHILRGIK